MGRVVSTHSHSNKHYKLQVIFVVNKNDTSLIMAFEQPNIFWSLHWK